MNGLAGVDFFRDGKANHFFRRFDYRFFQLHDVPVVVGGAAFDVDGVDAQEAQVCVDVFDFGDGFAADGDLGVFGYAVADHDYIQVGMLHVLQNGGNAAGDEG